MSSADSIVEALLDKCLRAKRAQRTVKIEFLDKISIVDECQARLTRFNSSATHDPSRRRDVQL
jgi:hypothetical protein